MRTTRGRASEGASTRGRNTGAKGIGLTKSLILAVLAVLALPSPASSQEAGLPGPLSGDQVVANCASCHPEADLVLPFKSLHAQAESCLTCHHVGFENDGQEVERLRLEACVSCHSPDGDPDAAVVGEDLSHLDLDGAPTCTACHSTHDQPTLTDPAFPVAMSASCSACHQDAQRFERAPEMVFAHGTPEDAASCVDCHSTHEPQVMTSTCVTCHEESLGVHPHPDDDGPECASCHTIHDPALVAVPAEGTGSCQSCHEDAVPAMGHMDLDGEEAPTCLSCHEFHGDGPAETADEVISTRCGECHSDEMREFQRSSHSAGFGAARTNRDAPDCTTCHVAHPDSIEVINTARMNATARCIECHSEALLAESYQMTANVGDSYLKDFHGQTLQFLYRHPEGTRVPNVMVCSDCHGAHDVRWMDRGEVAAVCLDCHEKGSEALAGAWLGHDKIGPRNGTLIWLTWGFYWFLIPFSLGGLLVNIVLHLRTEQKHGARMKNAEGVERIRGWLKGQKAEPEPTVQRFNMTQRLEHLGSMMTFILLVVTGLPQIYHSSGFAMGIIRLFGGIQMTRYIHRGLGVLFVALMVMHLTKGVIAALKKRRMPIMVPTVQDFRDTLQTFRHFLVGEPKPKVGKFDFASKYEYWGLLLGGSLMATTGFLLLFPVFFTQFLPGIFIAVAKVAHGLEGTFAFMVVVLWHSWGVVLRPEVFPLDTTIFTGKMTVARLKEEHPLEYERIFGVKLPEEPAPEGTGPLPVEDPLAAPS